MQFDLQREFRELVARRGGDAKCVGVNVNRLMGQGENQAPSAYVIEMIGTPAGGTIFIQELAIDGNFIFWLRHGDVSRINNPTDVITVLSFLEHFGYPLVEGSRIKAQFDALILDREKKRAEKAALPKPVRKSSKKPAPEPPTDMVPPEVIRPITVEDLLWKGAQQ